MAMAAITDQQLYELIDISVSLDYEAKKRWASYVPYLSETDRKKLFNTLNLEKEQLQAILKKRLVGVRGSFFMKSIENLEKKFSNLISLS